MNNPNPNYAVGPVLDPDADFDPEQFFDHVFDALTLRETEIRRWMEAEGFVDVRVRRLPRFGPDGWECLMLGDQNSGCSTCDDLKALVTRLAHDFRSEVQQDEIWAVASSDRLGTHFRLRPLPPQ
jgi:hypothetical protein